MSSFNVSHLTEDQVKYRKKELQGLQEDGKSDKALKGVQTVTCAWKGEENKWLKVLGSIGVPPKLQCPAGRRVPDPDPGNGSDRVAPWCLHQPGCQ